MGNGGHYARIADSLPVLPIGLSTGNRNLRHVRPGARRPPSFVFGQCIRAWIVTHTQAMAYLCYTDAHGTRTSTIRVRLRSIVIYTARMLVSP
jgi:hypothetical protein